MPRGAAGPTPEQEVGAWYAELASRSNEAFLPLFFDQHRYLVLKGGGGSGKSVFAATKLLERCLAEPGHRFLVCRKVARTIRESCFRLLERIYHAHYSDAGARFGQSDLYIRFDNGSEVLFAGLDDVEKLKSITDITGIWIEEASELEEADFNQLDIRLRGETAHYKQIILSFNPISVTHWLKRRFFDAPDERTRTSETTYKDNRFLDAEAVRTLESFRDTDPYYYDVYCLGQWGVTGQTVFNARDIQARLAEDIRPVRIGRMKYSYDGLSLTESAFADAADGDIRIYAEPVEGVPYVIGADTAGEGSDSFVAQVIDNRTGAQVAILRQRTDEDLFARQLYALGRWYNDALIGVETNFSTYPVMELERLRYPKQYVRETVDDYTHRTRKSYGFRTDARTRPVIIAGLVEAVRDDVSIVSDRTTLEEMLTFVRTERWDKPEAEPGAHDDCVMALAIAHGIRGQQSFRAVTPESERRPWTPDMWEDYRRAGRDEREMLIKRWGTPA